MSAKANQAICELYERTVFDIREFVTNRNAMAKLEKSYFRYRELARLDLQYREAIRRHYGLLGVHFPEEFVSSETAKQLSPLDNISSNEIRKELRLWEILEEYLTVVGESTYSEFRSFLSELKFTEPTNQAIDSAVRTHADLFEVHNKDWDKLIKLKAVSNG